MGSLLTKSDPLPSIYRPPPCLVAHRGYHTLVISAEDDHPFNTTRPNTWEALQKAWCMGIKICECDVRITADKELILSHSPEVKLPGGLSIPIHKTNMKRHVLSHPYTTLERAYETAVDCRGQLILDIKAADDLTADISMAMELFHFFSTRPQYISCTAAIICFDYPLLNRIAGNLKKNPNINFPFMLLTCADCDPSGTFFSIQTPSLLNQILAKSGGNIDGLYIQYEDCFMTDPNFKQNLAALCAKVPIGIWNDYKTHGNNNKKDVDGFKLLSTYEKCGVKFVNTDYLPEIRTMKTHNTTYNTTPP